LNLIVLAIPVFFALIAVELLAAWIAGKPRYRLADAVSDLSCGIVQQLTELVLKAALFAGYVLIFERFRIATLGGDRLWAWIACLVGVDFLYYWFHRTSHEVGAMWATHVVHHQSEDFNLAVALRQGAFQGAFSWVFYLPLAWLGFPPLLFLTVSSINTLYQFWIHTETIGKLGPLEWVFNTPSHHRVHHGRNPEYIDRNHAGMFIVWDRLFGTFEPERAAPVYGITTPLRSWNPVWANAHYWVELLSLARQARRLSDRLRVFLKPPGWRPAALGGPQLAPPVDARTYVKFDTARTWALDAYVVAQFLVVLVGTAYFLRLPERGSLAFRLAAGVLILWSVVALGWLLEGRAGARVFEAGRLAAIAGLAVAGGPALAAIPFASASLLWLRRASGSGAGASRESTVESTRAAQ
jgi:sterol desaturase/sphingolipid hydroxylase (fatty acid hydroxylase superfamily)